MDNEQVANAESPSSNQPRNDSIGDDGLLFAGGYFIRSLVCFFSIVFTFSLSPEVVRRVNALRNLQVEHHKIEASFFEEVHALECRYLSKYQPLYEKV